MLNTGRHRPDYDEEGDLTGFDANDEGSGLLSVFHGRVVRHPGFGFYSPGLGMRERSKLRPGRGSARPERKRSPKHPDPMRSMEARPSPNVRSEIHRRIWKDLPEPPAGLFSPGQ
jgi:hypothetical protein